MNAHESNESCGVVAMTSVVSDVRRYSARRSPCGSSIPRGATLGSRKMGLRPGPDKEPPV